MGQARKRDANEAPIVQALEAIGVKVKRISEKGFADLVCWHPRCGVRLLEVKGPKGRATTAQYVALAEGWPVITVRSIDDALRLFTGV